MKINKVINEGELLTGEQMANLTGGKTLSNTNSASGCQCNGQGDNENQATSCFCTNAICTILPPNFKQNCKC